MSTSVRVTVDGYDRMIAEGRFDPPEAHHVELIEGEIIPMSPINPAHSDAVRTLVEWSVLNAPLAEVCIQSQDPVSIPGLDSVPQPDVAWLRRRSYRRRRPEATDVLLLVEVADSSLSYDRDEKASLYAEAGVADYWIVNVPDECVEVRREPRGGAYRSATTFRAGESVPLLAFPAVALPVAVLFPDDEPADQPGRGRPLP